MLIENLNKTITYIEAQGGYSKAKKTLVILMCIVLALSAILAGCGAKEPETLKFGMGVYGGTPTVTDATADKNGTGKVDVTVAAVTVDADGKITAKQVEDYYLWQQNDESVEHIVQPGMVYISLPTENGTLYKADE